MAKRTYTDEALNHLLKESITMDFIDSLSGQSDDLTGAASFYSLVERSNNEFDYIDLDFIN